MAASELLATFRIVRNPQVDKLFNVADLERLYAGRYKGIGSGDSEKAAIETLGEPDLIESWQPGGYFRYSYFKDDIMIQFQDSCVKTIQRGVPPSLKKKRKKEGNTSREPKQRDRCRTTLGAWW